jgi:hypothetical protein
MASHKASIVFEEGLHLGFDTEALQASKDRLTSDLVMGSQINVDSKLERPIFIVQGFLRTMGYLATLDELFNQRRARSISSKSAQQLRDRLQAIHTWRLGLVSSESSSRLDEIKDVSLYFLSSNRDENDNVSMHRLKEKFDEILATWSGLALA